MFLIGMVASERGRRCGGVLWAVPQQMALHKKMRLAKSVTVSNFELLKPPYVGVAADSVIRPFFEFFSIPLAYT